MFVYHPVGAGNITKNSHEKEFEHVRIERINDLSFSLLKELHSE